MMDDHTKGYLEGLQAAALICQESAGERNSHLSDKIMALHSRKVLEGEMSKKAQYERAMSFLLNGAEIKFPMKGNGDFGL